MLKNCRSKFDEFKSNYNAENKASLMCDQYIETKEKNKQVYSASITGKYASHYSTFEYLEF